MFSISPIHVNSETAYTSFPLHFSTEKMEITAHYLTGKILTVNNVVHAYTIRTICIPVVHFSNMNWLHLFVQPINPSLCSNIDARPKSGIPLQRTRLNWVVAVLLCTQPNCINGVKQKKRWH
jgi:hypothetical protein